MALTRKSVRSPLHETVRQRLHPRIGFLALIAVAALVAWVTGRAIAGGGLKSMVVVVGAMGVAGATAISAISGERLRGALFVEIPIVLLVLSNQVFLIRTAIDIANDPVDSAGAFRIALVSIAALLGLFALLAPRQRSATADRLTTTPIRFYMAYVAVVFLGAPISVNPLLTAYRGIELTAALIVMLGAWKVLGQEAPRRIGNFLYWVIAGLVGTVWAAVVLAPGLAIVHFADLSVPIPFALVGVFPALSSNTVGALGVILSLWSLVRATSPDPKERLTPLLGYGLAGLGFLTLLGAQYRTGYVAFILGMLAFLALRRKWAALWVLTLAIPTVLILMPSLIGKAEPYALRGTRSVTVTTLDSRTLWWSRALEVWREDPLLGRGLLTGTRFEVLAPLGLEDTSTIHSTWVEALVGTGVVGISLVALSFLLTAKGAAREALTNRGSIAPALLLLVLFIRSFTGSTFEVFQTITLLFLWMALSMRPESEAALGPKAYAPIPRGRRS